MLAFLDGNEAVVRGALDAGCRFFAGYPITPASSIFSGMVERLPAAGGVAVQGEDEIASIGMCIGASMAGMRAMTATSGPGLCLMSESLGLAQMLEAPLVVVDVQRQGPATGSATQVAQGDVQFARWSGPGGLPMPVFCPSTPREAYMLMGDAFAAAERLRTPVLVLSDREIGMTRERVDLSDWKLPEVPDRPRFQGDGYVPYRAGDAGRVPDFAPAGGDHLTRFTTSTHDETGRITTKLPVIASLVDRLHRKIADHAAELARFREDREPGAETLIVSYGIAARSATEAVIRARRKGHRVSLLVLQTLWPAPEDAIRRAMEGMRRVVVPELNLGQYRLEIERLARGRVEVVGVHRMDTGLIAPEEILEKGGIA